MDKHYFNIFLVLDETIIRNKFSSYQYNKDSFKLLIKKYQF